ncbi:MAG: Bro-N domain-containing protein [Bacteroidales bacterium]|nr:Bro-N domain-containing protein [Bacteroidales bacterium]
MSNTKNSAGTVLPQAFTFNASNQQVRTVTIDGEPYFVAADVCSCLSISNNRQAVASLDDDEKRVSVVMTPLGGPQSMTVINESGLYDLIFQSRKPEAKAFRKWVTSEVLPSLRKTGEYRLQARKPGRPRFTRGEIVNAEILNLLWLIGESLEHGDINDVALELGVSRQTVSRTLNGSCRSGRVLMALYARARRNREQYLLYSQPGVMAERLLEGSAVPQGNHLPAVRFDGRKRGGSYGNQNARKSNRKDGGK